MIQRKALFSALLSLLLLLCSAVFSADAQAQEDYRPKMQNLSQQIHETLDESNQQSMLLMQQLEVAMNDLRLSQEQVSELGTQVKDLSISLANTNARLTDSSTKLILLESNYKREKKTRWTLVLVLILENIILITMFILRNKIKSIMRL